RLPEAAWTARESDQDRSRWKRLSHSLFVGSPGRCCRECRWTDRSRDATACRCRCWKRKRPIEDPPAAYLPPGSKLYPKEIPTTNRSWDRDCWQAVFHPWPTRSLALAARTKHRRLRNRNL